MDRLPPRRADTRTLAQHHDAQDFSALILAALSATPVDEQALRDGVWTYVRGERAIGVAPDLVIAALAGMVGEAGIVPHSARLARTHEVTQWCVEAYYGQLGGDAMRLAPLRADLPGQPAVPRPAERPAPPTETAHADWRERLTRNLSRRTDGPWEPLTFTPEPPAGT